MTRTERENHIYDRLRGKPHLLPLQSNVFAIPERIEEYDPALFIVLNTRTQRYEVHSLANRGNTYCFAVGFNQIDSRILHTIRESNIRVRGREIFDEIDRHNEKIEKRRERQWENERRARIEEMKPTFAKVAWGEI